MKKPIDRVVPRRLPTEPSAPKPAAKLPNIRVKKTAIGELAVGQNLERDGELLRVREAGPGGVVACKLEWSKGGDCLIERNIQYRLPPDTLVIAK